MHGKKERVAKIVANQVCDAMKRVSLRKESCTRNKRVSSEKRFAWEERVAKRVVKPVCDALKRVATPKK